MKWIEVKVYYEGEDNEKVKSMIIEAFNDLGINELVFKEPVSKSVLDFYKNENLIFNGTLSIAGYFPVNRYLDLKKKKFKSILIEKLKDIEVIFEIIFNETDEENWKDNWKKFFKTTRISEKIIIKPTWDRYDPKDNEIIINIDPGRAFGTGAHETTALCIRMLEKYIKKGNKVVDIGIGSGILSILAALLGAEYIKGTDIDTDAVIVANENMELNNIDKKKYSFTATENLNSIVENWGDIAVSNIIADILVNLIPEISKKIKSGGIFITSGILKEKRKLIKEALIENNFEIIDEEFLHEWLSIIGRKK